ncbi:MAG: hypothetical protein AAF182_02845 [Pseudomonadota bacterium]
MRISKFFITVLFFQFIASGAMAQSLPPQSKSPFKGGMNHVQMKKTPTYYNKIEPASGSSNANQLIVPQTPREGAQSELEKQVWAKYQTLTNAGRNETQTRQNHLSITTPEQTKATVQKKTITPAAPKPKGGIAGLLEKYEERKASRSQVQSLGLEN